MEETKEAWKAIAGYEGVYEVSSTGRVRRISKHCQLMSLQSRGKYMAVHLKMNGAEKVFCVHRLVAGAFIPNPKNYPFINHIDGNPSNNNVSNLEWCTQEMNMRHAIKNNLVNHRSKSVVLTSLKTGEKHSFRSMVSAGLFLGYSGSGGLYRRTIKDGIARGYKVEIEYPGRISRAVAKYSKGGEFLCNYPSIKKASEDTNATILCIRQCCMGVIKTAGGYIWKFI